MSPAAVVTTCCAEKRPDREPLPAIERYLAPRIAAVRDQARAAGLPFYILSGEFGLLAGHAPIPWYDHALEPEEVEALTERVVLQLARAGVTRVEFHARPRDVPGWAPYHEVMERACHRTRLPLAVRVLGREGS